MPAGLGGNSGACGLVYFSLQLQQRSSAQLEPAARRLSTRRAASVTGTCASARINPSCACTSRYRWAGIDTQSGLLLSTPAPVMLAISKAARTNRVSGHRAGPVLCTPNVTYAPVCGNDGQTYGNLQILACANVPLSYLGQCLPCAEDVAYAAGYPPKLLFDTAKLWICPPPHLAALEGCWSLYF